MKTKLFIILLTTVLNCKGQEVKSHYFLWTYHESNVNIHGISVGLGSSFTQSTRNANTNGLKIELIGLGLILPLMPYSPVVQSEEDYKNHRETDTIIEKINGVSLSASGSGCACRMNGFTTGFIGQSFYEVNGLSASLFLSFTQLHNGVQVASFNESYKINGAQLGLSNTAYVAKGAQLGAVNYAKDLRGIQVGLWNINGKRSLPLINWQFSENHKS